MTLADEQWLAEPRFVPGDGSVADRLETSIRSLPPHGVTLRELRDLVGRDGLMLLAAFLTIVFLVPVSVPGVSTVFGTGILLIGISRMTKRDLWLPDRLGNRIIATGRLLGMLHRGLATFRRLERVSRPHRVSWATSSPAARVVNDSGIILGAILLMAPFGLIPFSNTLPAVALLFLAIGTLQKDGLCIVIGHVSNLGTMSYFAFLIGGGGLAVVVAVERLLGL